MAMEAAEDNGTAGKTVMRNLIMKNDNVLHHDNLYRPSPSYYWFNGHDAADIVAPNFPKLNNTNNNIISTSSFQSASAPAAPQTTSFNFSFLGEKGRMIPFTNGQWKELERQALIYKYMMASVPVPPHLLSPSYSLGGGMNVMMRPYSNGVGGDPEAGRCRRTDGKKWRCSREAAPDQKYCERHLHRGRPRSRKPVEPSLSTVDSKNIINKKIRIESDDHSRSFPSQIAGNVISSPFYQIQPLNKDQRCLDLMMKGEATPSMSSSSSAHQWQNYMMTMQEKPPPNSDSISNFFINPDLNSVQNHHQSREFIDAWSNKVSSCNNDYYDSNEYSPLSLSIKDETGSRVFRSGQTHEYDNTSWLAPVPWAHRGPLGEVFMPSSVTDPAASDPLSPAVDTTVSSPSGVLQKTLGASWSDRSGSNSPTTLASSKA